MTNLTDQIKQLNDKIKSECVIEGVVVDSLYKSHELAEKMKELLLSVHGNKDTDFDNVRNTMLSIEKEALMMTNDSMFELLLSAK